MPFSSFYHWRQHGNPLVLVTGHDHVDDLVHRIADHSLTGHIRVRIARPRKKQTHEIIDLGDGSNGRTRILIHGFLLDRDHRAQAGDLIHIGPLHATEKLARVSREGFYVTPLTFRVDRVKRKRGFPASAQARYHHQFFTRDIKGDVLQVMHPRTDHFKGFYFRFNVQFYFRFFRHHIPFFTALFRGAQRYEERYNGKPSLGGENKRRDYFFTVSAGVK